MIKTTTYTLHNTAFNAVMLSWDEVEEILGREHRGTPADDDALVAHLLEAGAPEWVRDAEGATDEDGWYLLGEEVEEN